MITSLRTITLSLVLLLWASIAVSQEPAIDGPRYVADVELQTTAEFAELLNRASQLMVDDVAGQGGGARVTFVLHGPVIRDLLRQNYPANREVVNIAASLSALEVVEIKVCRTWMGMNAIDEADLLPFAEPVNLASSEVQRLRREQSYLDF